ncbi:MAG: DUF2804 domain-containing protein [Deltaproteobacteria bacterium]|nr:DUF2804 domain-containing protein [Deltaproteobacteria bacterium]
MELREGTRLIEATGRPGFGLYRDPLTDLDVRELRVYGKDKRGPGRGFCSLFRFKRWQYLGVCNERLICGIAVVSLGYLGQMFAYVYERAKGELREHESIRPLGIGIRIDGSSASGRARFRGGRTQVDMTDAKEFILLKADIEGRFKADLKFERYRESLNLVSRVGLAGFNYTTKESGMPVEGTVVLDGRSYGIERADSSGVLDYTLGLLSRRTFWNWASGGGFDAGGKRVGFNLVQGVNETGYTENVFWVDGRMVKTDTVDFRYDDLDLMKPWTLLSRDGKINLVFYPEGERKKNVNLGFLMSRFRQPFGRFEGTLGDGGQVYRVRSAWGFTEEHEAKW